MKLDEVLIKKSDPKDLPFMGMADSDLDDPEMVLKNIKKNKSLKILGSGIEAVVYSEKDNPNVIKALGTYVDSIKDIPYIQYILLSFKYSKENPYFPKVYDIKKYKMKDDGISVPYIFSFKIEPLIHIQKLNIKDQHSLWEKMFNDSIPEGEHTIEYHISNRVRILAEHGGTAKYVKDKNLSKATQLIHKIVQKDDSVYVDIHYNNIMARRTPYGPQLVITDPLTTQI
jgi:hypothetical protein